MASLALMALGNAVFPAAAGSIAWGATMGAMAGSYLDQAFIMPALFPVEQQKISVGKLDELQLQSASEGTPINRCYGEATPCIGTVIWLSDLIEVASTEDVGGKGGSGGGSEVTTYSYFVDAAIGVCKGPREITHIWADGKLIYLANPEATTIMNLTGNIYVRHIGRYAIMMDVVYDSSGVLPDFDVGRSVGLSGTGFNVANEGVFKLVSKYIDDSNLTHLRFFNDDAVSQTLSGSNTIMSQSIYVVTGQYDSLTIYQGNQVSPDPTIESYKGAGNVPAYKGLCYAVFHRLKLTDYGNRLPNLRFLVEKYEAPA